MFGFGGKKTEPVAVEKPPQPTAILGMTTQPLMINPDADEDTKQKLYRRDAITRHITQAKAEGRTISPQRSQEFEDEYAILTIELRKRGAL